MPKTRHFVEAQKLLHLRSTHAGLNTSVVLLRRTRADQHVGRSVRQQYLAAELNGSPLRCAGGADLGDACLSDAQLQALRVFNTPIEFKPAMAGGETHYPGYNLYGSDLGMVRGSPVQPLVTALALGTVPPRAPLVPGESPAIRVDRPHVLDRHLPAPAPAPPEL